MLTLDNLRNLYRLAESREGKLPEDREDMRKRRALTDKIWNMLLDVWDEEHPTWESQLLRR